MLCVFKLIFSQVHDSNLLYSCIISISVMSSLPRFVTSLEIGDNSCVNDKLTDQHNSVVQTTN